MELVSSVRTIMGIAQEVVAAAGTASQNKSRCKKVAERVRCLKDILEPAAAAATDDDAATRRLLDRLEEALRRALQEVRRCQRGGGGGGGGSFLRSVIVAVVAGGGAGRMTDPLDSVEAEIDRCILDLAVANSVRIARLETLVRQQHTVAVAASTDVESDKDERKKKGSADDESGVVPDKMMDHENTTATAIGVPVCTVTAAGGVHEMVPPPCYGYYGGYGYRSCHGYYWRNHGCTCDCWDGADSAGRPYDVAFYNNTQYASCPSMFSDDDPNSCSIM